MCQLDAATPPVVRSSQQRMANAIQLLLVVGARLHVASGGRLLRVAL
jgi:hypothetical protein